jgi:hypothetical protein
MKNSSTSVWRLIPIFLLALFNLSPSWVAVWSYDGSKFREHVFSSEQFLAIQPLTSAEIEGINYCLQLENRQVKVYPCHETGSAPEWQSPGEWEVHEAFFSDLNHDGREEVTLLLWREFQPWPVDRFLPKGGRISGFHDSNDRSCHVILISLKDGSFREAWAGSAMADPLRKIYAADLDGDGAQELAGLEYRYNESEYDSSLVVWEWNGFGFSLGDRISGSFSEIQVVQNLNDVLLLTQ